MIRNLSLYCQDFSKIQFSTFFGNCVADIKYLCIIRDILHFSLYLNYLISGNPPLLGMSNTLQKESIGNTESFPQELVYQSVIDGSDEMTLFVISATCIGVIS